MNYTIKKIRNLVNERFEEVSKDAIKPLDKLYDEIKGKVINEQSTFPSLMAVLALSIYIPLSLILTHDLSLFITVTATISTLTIIPYYWFKRIKNPYR